VVDEQALLAALQRGAIGGAALDVFAQEPHVPQAFFSLDNVVMLPHSASATHETRAAMGQRVLDNLASFFSQVSRCQAQRKRAPTRTPSPFLHGPVTWRHVMNPGVTVDAQPNRSKQ
jgi:lactate dehydrogenase-like 2-hydroxyacid dehydrogenase